MLKPNQKPNPQDQSSCCQPNEACSENKEKTWGLPQKNPHKSHCTRVTIHYDVGFNNTLTIRGKGANLAWDHGIPLRNVAPDLWVWETEAPFTMAEFKILINDRVFEDGANHTVKCGAQVEYTPHFLASV